MFVFSGPGIKNATTIQNAHILDITPTVLYYLGLPVAKDMDGKPIPLFTEDFQTKNPLKTITTYEIKPRKSKRISSPMDKEIIKKLRGLGYIK